MRLLHRLAGAALFGAGLLASRAHAAYTVERIVGGLNQPIHMAQAPGENNSIYIVERSDAGNTLGRIRRYDLQTRTFSTFLDLTGTIISDGGLLSLTFHPSYESNGLFYIVTNNNRVNGLDEYKTVNGVPQFQRRLVQYQNLANVFHTMNQALFRPGGNNNELFLTTGDGGTQANEPGFNPGLIESPTSPYGKIMKIDLTQPFATPASGPGPGVSVVALGLRNPYRAGFDRQTGDYYFGDVGFEAVESIDFIPASHFANPAAPVLDFGWTDREGTIARPTPPNNPGGPGSATDVKPIFDYAHNNSIQLPHSSVITGGSVTGGFVYRGAAPELQGRYFFADFLNGSVYSGVFDRTTNPQQFNGANLTNVVDHTTAFENLIGGGANIRNVTSWAEDNAGNLYIVKFGNAFFPPLGQGEIFRITPIIAGAIQVQVDRQTGAISLVNSSDQSVAFNSYVITSGFGAIDAADFTPIAGNYDSLGDGSVDDDNPWQVTSPAGSRTQFGEATTGDAGAISAHSQVSLSAGGGWIQSPVEDLVVSLVLDGGAMLNASVTYAGNGGQPFRRGDLDFDGILDIGDWEALAAGSYSDLAGLSRAEAYAKGDLDGDGDNDFNDFRLFKGDFDAANGAGAFAAMTGEVPEPSSAMLISAAAALAAARSRRTRPACRRARPFGVPTSRAVHHS